MVDIRATVNTGDKNVALIIHDAESVAAAVAKLTGHEELGEAIDVLSKYVDKAIQGAEDAHSIQITADSIAALLPNVKLDPPEPATTPAAGAQSGTEGAQTSTETTGAQTTGTDTGTTSGTQGT